MKYSIFLIFTIISFSTVSCENNTNEILTGNVFIKLVDLGSLYKASREDVYSMKEKVDNFKQSNSNESEKLLYNYYKVLFDNNLADKPYCLIKDERGKIRRVFFSLENYREVERLLPGLDKNKEQINLSLKVVKVNEDIYITNKIIYIRKIKGKTEWAK